MKDAPNVEVELVVPDGWTCRGISGNRFRVLSGSTVEDRNTITVRFSSGQSVAFTMLGPGEAKGFPAGNNVPTCPKCQARVEACIYGPA